MYTNHSNMAAGFHNVLAHIPSCRDTDRFDGAIYAVFANNVGNLLAHIAGSRIDSMGRAQFFRQFQAVFVHIANDNGGRTIQLRSQQRRHTDRAGTCNEYGIARFHITILHADFMGGRQGIAQQQGNFFVDVVRQRNQAVVGIRCTDVFGLSTVNHVAQDPTAVAAV